MELKDKPLRVSILENVDILNPLSHVDPPPIRPTASLHHLYPLTFQPPSSIHPLPMSLRNLPSLFQVHSCLMSSMSFHDHRPSTEINKFKENLTPIHHKPTNKRLNQQTS